MFGDYMNPDMDQEDRVYEEVKSVETMYQVAEQCLVEYNNQSKNRMNLVIFGSVGCMQIQELHLGRKGGSIAPHCGEGCSFLHNGPQGKGPGKEAAENFYILMLKWLFRALFGAEILQV